MVILIIGLCLLMLSPFIWMIGASLKKEADVMKQGVGLFPTYWYPQNYLRVLGLREKQIIIFYRVIGILLRWLLSLHW